MSVEPMSFLKKIENIKLKKWGKYIITILIFGVIYIFVGDQSVVRFIQRGEEIKHLEEQRDMYLEEIEKVRREMNSLSHPDSLERFAREQYYMHNANEDIYLVDED
jgi:cell division protein FtsB